MPKPTIAANILLKITSWGGELGVELGFVTALFLSVDVAIFAFVWQERICGAAFFMLHDDLYS